jgi:hypothetical protein
MALSLPLKTPLRIPGASTSEAVMKKKAEPVETLEPIGIIISNGERGEKPTVFSAYIWGPAPEPSSDPATKAA